MNKRDPIDWFLNGPVSDADVATKWAQLKQSANSRGIEFSLSLGKVRQLLKAKNCYYTRVSFTPAHQEPNSKSIDRVENNIGYTDANTVACCLQINTMKGSLSVAQIVAIYKGVMKHVLKREAKTKPKLRTTAVKPLRKAS